METLIEVYDHALWTLLQVMIASLLLYTLLPSDTV